MPVEVLMKSAPASGQPGRAPHVAHGDQLAGLADHLQVRPAADLLDRGDLVEDLEVAARQEGAAVDHHVHLVGAGGDRVLHVGQLDVQAGPAAGERGGDAGHVDAGALEFGRRDMARSGYTQTAATTGAVGSAGSGRLALAHSARTLPGVSWPSSVVGSIIEMAASSAHRLAVVLMDRLASMAARASARTRSTRAARAGTLAAGLVTR